MEHNLINLMSPIVGLGINVLVQVSGFRFLASLPLLKSLFLGCGVGLIGVTLMESYLHLLGQPSGNFIALFWTNGVIYMALSYCYFHFINMGETARRIRILRELNDSDNGLTMDEILKRYNANDMIRMRMDRLLNNGQVYEKEGRYYIGNPLMLWISKGMVAMKRFMLGKGSEFD
ncbi:MAG: hypothetical protein COV66_10620 [Nitrospinae bacterium CG11_big_fil_rev_8_21_14_0_20_45_15]|nr:MAG: hypothetical protein COV66_10620 [Nitrospinae bacterium CG11_big_fil_rev_8_21_14_0_20_45_15]